MHSQSANRRTFTLRLSDHYMEYLRMYAFVYRHLLERVGVDVVEGVWRESNQAVADDLFASLLGAGWTNEDSEGGHLIAQRAELIERLFTPAVESVGPESATRFLMGIDPFASLDAAFPDLNVQRDATTYEALHLLVHGLASFAEAFIARIGQAAEFMIYDALKEEIADRMSPEMQGRDWLRAIFDRNQNAQPDASPAPSPPLVMGSAGHVEKIIRVAQDEIIVHMTQCSWAEYYLDRHPTVGQLLGCSVDDPTYRRTAIGLRLQRQCTLMAGDELCDFRIYPAG